MGTVAIFIVGGLIGAAVCAVVLWIIVVTNWPMH